MQGPQGIQGLIGQTGPQGPAGPAGADGAPGPTPYQIAVSKGYSGTEDEYNSLLYSIGDLNTLLDEFNGEVV